MIKYYDKVFCCYNNKHDATMSISFFIDTSLTKHVDDFRYRLSLEDKRGLNLGELIHPFCFIFPTVIEQAPHVEGSMTI